MSLLVVVNFAEISKNAADQGVNLAEITIVYGGLSSRQISKMKEAGLLVQNLGSGKCFGRFAKDGTALFESNAVSVLYLAA